MISQIFHKHVDGEKTHDCCRIDRQQVAISKEAAPQRGKTAIEG